MKTIAKIACLLIAVGSSLAWGQCATWTTSTIRNCNGYDYELWSENNAGTTTMNITGNSTDGGTFTAEWRNTINILFRAGKKWGSSSTTTARSVGNITVDFDAAWSSTDGVKMLGVYGWAYYPSGSSPTKDENGTSRNYSNQIEYYIIQDRGNYNAASSGTNAKKYGNGATIDGIDYDFYVADRIGKCALTGNCDVNFKQYFSVPKNASSHRTKGVITVSKHFEEWEKAGMKIMDCPLYEVAMKVESYTGSGSSQGTARVTKNLLTLGGSLPSSGSGGGTSSSSAVTTPSSSSVAKTQATTCKTPLITYPTNTVPSDPYTACFQYTNGKCYVCKVENEQGNNTCASGWVWSGNQIESNLESGYWYQEVACPAGSSSSNAESSSSEVASSSSDGGGDISPIKATGFVSSQEVVEIYDIRGNKKVGPLQSGVYFAKIGKRVVEKIVIK